MHLALDALGEPDLQAVAHVVAALQARRVSPTFFDPASYGQLYLEFAAEDRALAEHGMEGFSRGLEFEDHS